MDGSVDDEKEEDEIKMKKNDEIEVEGSSTCMYLFTLSFSLLRSTLTTSVCLCYDCVSSSFVVKFK